MHSLFSPNESFKEINTEYLKYQFKIIFIVFLYYLIIWETF